VGNEMGMEMVEKMKRDGREKMLSYTGVRKRVCPYREEQVSVRVKGKISAQVYLDLEDWRTVLIFLYSTS
jgi:hypothetical protein